MKYIMLYLLIMCAPIVCMQSDITWRGPVGKLIKQQSTYFVVHNKDHKDRLDRYYKVIIDSVEYYSGDTISDDVIFLKEVNEVICQQRYDALEHLYDNYDGKD